MRVWIALLLFTLCYESFATRLTAAQVDSEYCLAINGNKPKDVKITKTCNWTPVCDFKHTTKLTAPGTKTEILIPDSLWKCEYCDGCPDSAMTEPLTIACTTNYPTNLQDTFAFVGIISYYTTADTNQWTASLQKTLSYEAQQIKKELSLGTITLKRCHWSNYEVQYAQVAGKQASIVVTAKWTFKEVGKCPVKTTVPKPADVVVDANYTAATGTATIIEKTSIKNKLIKSGKCPVPPG